MYLSRKYWNVESLECLYGPTHMESSNLLPIVLFFQMQTQSMALLPPLVGNMLHASRDDSIKTTWMSDSLDPHNGFSNCISTKLHQDSKLHFWWTPQHHIEPCPLTLWSSFNMSWTRFYLSPSLTFSKDNHLPPLPIALVKQKEQFHSFRLAICKNLLAYNTPANMLLLFARLLMCAYYLHVDHWFSSSWLL